MGKGDRQNIRTVAVCGAEKRNLLWLARNGDNLYGNVWGLGFHYSRHESGEFHLTHESGSHIQELSVAILTTTWTRHNISRAVQGLRELFAGVMFFNLREEWGNYRQFTPKKDYDKVIEIHCAAVDSLNLKVWLTDIHNVSSLRLVEDQANADWRRLCSEIVETGRQWLLLVEAYDTTASLPPLRDKELPPLNYAEAFKARLLGNIRFREYLAIRNRELGLKS